MCYPWALVLLLAFMSRILWTAGNVVSLTNFNRCSWVIALSSSREPDKVLKSYFNEKGLFDVKDKLKDPDITNFLHPVTRHDSVGYFVFPYFVLVRATCDSGFYEDSYYRLIMNGDYPTIVLNYWPATSRLDIKQSLQVTSTGALVNVHPDEAHKEVPLNPQAPVCYMRICYPSFVVPLVFLYTPIFEVTVEAVDEFSKSKTKIHVSPFHSRKSDGEDDLVLTEKEEKPALPSDYFPVERIAITEDELSLTPEILEDLEDQDHFPLDKEDFVEPQYAYGAAPVVMFSGFYDPQLIILADPDLMTIQLVRWGRNPLLGNKSDDNSTIFDHGLSCNLRTFYDDDDKYPVPYYTMKEGQSKQDWLSTYYRKRFLPLPYNEAPVPKAIFGTVALEDRVLLVTNSGLVAFYGDTNATMASDSALKATSDEKLRKCFKLVRTSRFSYQETDLVVAVTYNHTELKTFTFEGTAVSSAVDVDQEIYLGKLSKLGQPMEWIKLGETAGMDISSESEHESMPICNTALKQHFSRDIKDVELQQCLITDATPVSGIEETIQLLVEMVLLHKPTERLFNDNPNPDDSMVEEESLVTFYIIAQYTPLSTFSSDFWVILSIVPKRPCKESHDQSIQNIQNFDTNLYFHHLDHDDDVLEDLSTLQKSCHLASTALMVDDLHLLRMTYSRRNDGALFLYGNKLILSADRGEGFVHMQGFPSWEERNETLTAISNEQSHANSTDPESRSRSYSKALRLIRGHVIRVMAFSNGVNFAFLTSKRHLYWGSTGTLTLLRLRPSPGYSMMRTILSENPGLHDGRPFSLLFDSEDRLFEMVAIVDSDKRVVDIRKREISWVLMTKNNNFVKKLMKYADRATPEEKKNIFSNGNKRFKTYCPYGDPTIYQNYTSTMTNVQHIAIRPPLQHHSLGSASLQSTLMAFQASTYSLIHKSFLQPDEQRFSHVAGDPLDDWVNVSRKEAEIGFFKYLTANPQRYGIIVDPSSFKRMDDSLAPIAKSMPQRLFLDYNQVVKIEVSFSVTTTGSIDKTDYRRQKLSELQITVDNGNGSVVDIETLRMINARQGVTTFTIFVSVKTTAHLPQNFPGTNPTIVPISLHFINAFQNCVPLDAGSYIGDSLHSSVYAGCPAASELQLNWNKTLVSQRFRDPKQWMGAAGDCYDDEPVCFYVKIPSILYFDVFDSAKQHYVPYDGKYTLRVVAVGYSKDSLTHFSESEITAYNIPGESDVSLIWSEWDLQKKEKVKVKRDLSGVDSADPILTSGTSAIKWTCHTLSPCARVLPTWKFQTIFYLKLRISNRGVDDNTLCLHERDFVVQLYGFNPSPETQLLISMVFCLLILLLLYVLYLCCRNNRRVWRANKLKMYGWLQIVVDTVPTSKTYSDTSKELSEQMRRDEILLSLQGHLRIPEGRLPSKPRPTVEVKKRHSKTSHPSDSEGEAESSSSSSSDESQDDVKIESGTLPSVHPRHTPATWTDMIYDQIITKRVHSIIDRNNKMKESILSKVEWENVPAYQTARKRHKN